MNKQTPETRVAVAEMQKKPRANTFGIAVKAPEGTFTIDMHETGGQTPGEEIAGGTKWKVFEGVLDDRGELYLRQLSVADSRGQAGQILMSYPRGATGFIGEGDRDPYAGMGGSGGRAFGIAALVDEGDGRSEWKAIRGSLSDDGVLSMGEVGKAASEDEARNILSGAGISPVAIQSTGGSAQTRWRVTVPGSFFPPVGSEGSQSV